MTTPAESVHYVVTEYGTAVLKGRTTGDRAVALINVAHPKFREALRDEALEKNIISPAEASEIILDAPVVADFDVRPYQGRAIASHQEGFFERIWNAININFFHVFKIYSH